MPIGRKDHVLQRFAHGRIWHKVVIVPFEGVGRIHRSSFRWWEPLRISSSGKGYVEGAGAFALPFGEAVTPASKGIRSACLSETETLAP